MTKKELGFFSLKFSKKNLYIIEFLSWFSLSLLWIHNSIIIVTKNYTWALLTGPYSFNIT